MENVIDFQYQNWNLVIKFSNELKFLPIDPVFSDWVKFILKKVSILECS